MSGGFRRAAKVDRNHAEITKALEALPGVSVKSVAQLKGFADIVVGYKGRNFIIEIKDGEKPPSRRRLTDDEKEFADSWFGQYDVAYCIKDAVSIIGYDGPA